MSLPVIVTRTLPGARDTADHLERLGHTPIRSPMLRIVETGLPPDALTGIRHIIFTSANGVRAVHGASFHPELTAWCVGPSTFEAARAAGLANVINSDGNAADLARAILDARPEGPLLHIANEAAAGELVATLREGGLDARFLAPYRTEAAAALSPEALRNLDAAGPVILLVHSAKAAQAVAASRPPLGAAALVAISVAAANPLLGVCRRGEWIAARPNEDSLMDALRNAAAVLCP